MSPLLRRSPWFLFLATLLPAILAAAAPSPFVGTWRYLPDGSTQLSGWDALDLVFAQQGATLTLTRDFSAGRRKFEDVTPLDPEGTVANVRVDWWPDNRHIGAYIGPDHQKQVRARWIEPDRILRTTTDLVLETQQGLHPVNILTDYRLSPRGDRLTVIELRSTRDRPTVYLFERVRP
ncbi:MAG TPA: hypothetical protein VHE61_19440 [Opitutaceae bacterium]|nr:hypothetical protein [Opitutaceae bacterium]